MLFNLIDFIYDSVLSLLLLLSFKALVFSLFYIKALALLFLFLSLNGEAKKSTYIHTHKHKLLLLS